MMTLAYEVWQQKREEKNKIESDEGGDEKKGQIMIIGSKQVQGPKL